MQPNLGSKDFPSEKQFLPAQLAWIQDHSPLKIMQKSRQVGITYAMPSIPFSKSVPGPAPGTTFGSAAETCTSFLAKRPKSMAQKVPRGATSALKHKQEDSP
jgi:hypothetical protein